MAWRVSLLRSTRGVRGGCYAGRGALVVVAVAGTIAGGCGGRSLQEQRRALSEYTETPIRQGHLESPWERLVGGLILGDAVEASGC